MKNPGILLCAVVGLLTGCGGGGSGAGPGDDGASGKSVTVQNGRALAIDVMQLLGVVLDYEGHLNGDLKDPESGQTDCGRGGVRTATVTDVDGDFGNAGDSAAIDYNQCRLSAPQGEMLVQGKLSVAINGGNTGSAGYDATLGFNGYSSTLGGVTFSLDGQYTVTAQSGAVSLSTTALTVNDGQNNWTIGSLDLGVDESGLADTVTVNTNANSSRAGFGVDAISDQPFTGSDLICPDSGKLTIKAADNSYVTIIGAAGVNLLLDVNGESGTLACSEIAASIAPPSDDGGLEPPPGP